VTVVEYAMCKQCACNVWCTDIRETPLTVYVWCADIRKTLVTVCVSCACMSGVQTLERH